MIGQTLDRYRIDAKLGEGGMGVVYKAHDTHLDRTVAIKVLPPDKVADPARKQRFVQEAKAASALNHPNIITVYDIRSAGGIDFIVMEYAAGRTLDQMIRAKGLGVARSLRLGAQMADALAAAHEAGIVHRDLKPSNVIVTDEDRVKVLDFGLAKLLDAADRSAAETRTVPVTELGMVVGTAAYMSPEQAEGRLVDARSDIFSFGAVLYEMVTGRKPFAGDSNAAVLAKILNDDPAPPSALAPSVTPDVERTILRCLRKDRARRYQTMADLKVVLDDLAADSASAQPAQTSAVRVSRRQRWAWVALVPVVLTAAFFALQALRSPESTAAPPRAVPLTVLPGVVQSPSFAPDGDRVAFAWTGPQQDNPDIYVQQIGAGAPLRLTTDPANDYSPVWSPDGRAIAFLRQQPDPRRSELRLIPPLGGPERRLTDIQPRQFLRPVTLAWCPDSRCVVVTDSSSSDDTKPDAVLFVVAIESGEKRRLTAPQPDAYADTDPAVSPDGRWLVFRRYRAPLSGQLQLLELGGDLTARNEPRSLTPTLLQAYDPEWISNTEILFSAKGSLWRMNPTGGRPAERLAFVGEDGQSPAISRPQPGRPARLVYVRSYRDTNIWRLDVPAPGAPASSPPVVAISSTRGDSGPQLSPDGRRVAFNSTRSGENEIWLADISGTNAVQLTDLRANPGYARWSPDGRTIVFQTNSEERPAGDVFVVPAEGGTPRNLTSHPANDAIASFSRDGRWIYFSSTRSGTPFIWKVPAAGGEAVQVSPTNGTLAIESMDGAYLYYVESQSTDTPGPLWRLPLNGGEPVRLVDGVFSVSFEVVSGGIYYLERLAGPTRLRYFDFATRQSAVVAGNLGNVVTGSGLTGLTASRDGRAIFFTRVDASVDDLMLVENFR